MALLDSEVARIRAELGYSVLTVSAEPYIGYIAAFTQVIQPYLSAGASTTCATAVTAATTPTVVSLTLASATGFNAGDRVWLDVDDLQESATVRSVTGSVISVALKGAHPAGYPVTVDGGEGIVREILANIRRIKAELAQTFGEGAIRKVDEVEFYPTRESTGFQNLYRTLQSWRAELSQVLSNGQQLNRWAQVSSGAQRVAVY